MNSSSNRYSKNNQENLREFLDEANEIINRVLENLHIIESRQGKFDNKEISNIYRDMHTLKGTAQLFGVKKIALISHCLEATLDRLRDPGSIFSVLLLKASFDCLNLLKNVVSDLSIDGQTQIPENLVIKTISALIEVATQDQSDNSGLINDFITTNDHEINNIKNRDVKNEKNPSDEMIIATPQVAMQESSIRVQVNQLDKILHLVGELVLIKNQFLQNQEYIELPDLKAATKNLDIITSALQNDVMKTRMQPISTITSKLSFLVKEISESLKKKVDLTVEGAGTELDKSILELIKDPLTQIIKNACDHGIENPEERLLANKPSTGHLLFKSFHEGGQVIIEISDDGVGLNVEKIKNKILEKKIHTVEELEKLSEQQIFNYIFLPDFSTTEEVSALSGRGVGMDIVKTNLSKVGGSVDVSSSKGRGTTVQLRIPLTLAIVPSLVILQGPHQYVLAQVRIVEMMKVASRAENQLNKIEYIQGRPILRTRKKIIPLVHLGGLLKNEFNLNEVIDEFVNIVVLDVDGKHYGLIIDEVGNFTDVVVRPLNVLLKHLKIFSGATILGDGSTSVILDIVGISEFANVFKKKEVNHQIDLHAKSLKKQKTFDIQEFLIFNMTKVDDENQSHFVIPLCLVQRLERISTRKIEYSGELSIIKYGDSILTLVDLKNCLTSTLDTKLKNKVTIHKDISELNVIVIKKSDKFYGFIVNEIEDILTFDATIDDSLTPQFGIMGNILFQKSIYVVIDALGIIDRILSNKEQFLPRKSLLEIKKIVLDQKQKKIRVLYAEDVVFFRKHVSKILSEIGIEVTTFEDGELAYQELIEAPPNTYNLILSDIEMPNKNGIEFAKMVRANEQYKLIPMIALTTRFNDSDIKVGFNAGFNAYLEKLNPEKLILEINKLMNIDDIQQYNQEHNQQAV